MKPFINIVVISRSPYGERGLKYVKQTATGERRQVALLTESVD